MLTDYKYLIYEGSTVHGRLKAGTFRGAERLARAFFPEVPDVRVIPWNEATNEGRHAAKLCTNWLTYEHAIKRGLLPAVEEWAEKLQSKFQRAGGGQ